MSTASFVHCGIKILPAEVNVRKLVIGGDYR